MADFDELHVGNTAFDSTLRSYRAQGDYDLAPVS
jgi:hypothetical protein